MICNQKKKKKMPLCDLFILYLIKKEYNDYSTFTSERFVHIVKPPAS